MVRHIEVGELSNKIPPLYPLMFPKTRDRRRLLLPIVAIKTVMTTKAPLSEASRQMSKVSVVLGKLLAKIRRLGDWGFGFAVRAFGSSAVFLELQGSDL